MWPSGSFAKTEFNLNADSAVRQRVALDSAELSHSLKVSGRSRKTSKLAQNMSESLCTGLWVSWRTFLAWFDEALGPIRLDIDDFRPDPEKFPGPLSAAELRKNQLG